MRKIYFARPISQYNNKQDQRDVDLLLSLGFNVVNPNKEVLNQAYKERGMDVFYDTIIDCDALAFRSFLDFKIGAGVAGEIAKAIEYKIPVIELPTITNSRNLTIEETRRYLELLGQR